MEIILKNKKYIFIPTTFLSITSIILVITFYILDYKIEFNIKKEQQMGFFENNLKENALLVYKDRPIYVIKEEDINFLQEKLNQGYINYNGEEKKFIYIDNRNNCDKIEKDGVLQYADADNKVLYKHYNCIPQTQKIKKMDE
jgi:hypothetical protein